MASRSFKAVFQAQLNPPQAVSCANTLTKPLETVDVCEFCPKAENAALITTGERDEPKRLNQYNTVLTHTHTHRHIIPMPTQLPAPHAPVPCHSHGRTQRWHSASPAEEHLLHVPCPEQHQFTVLIIQCHSSHAIPLSCLCVSFISSPARRPKCRVRTADASCS